MFVEMYGVPRYNDVDPTLLVAISYTLLFGIMFGDLGQGIILSLVGLVAEKKFNLKLGGVGVRLGISSAIFGVFFGSFLEMKKSYLNISKVSHSLMQCHQKIQ